MRNTSSKNIASLLLICFGIVFVHTFIPHSHNIEGHSEVKHQDFDHPNSHSHSILSDFFDLFKDISHTQIGENHLEEYLTAPKQLSSSKHQDNSDNLRIEENSDLELSGGMDNYEITLPTKPFLKTYHLGNLNRRGPPNQA